MAFAQLIVSGVALAMRIENSRTVKVVEKSVPASPQVVINPPPERVPPTPAPQMPPAAPIEQVATAPLPPPRPLLTPEIADPLAEKLVREAKAARVAEDMMSAITKLEQALQTSPAEANVLYELGLCHETMGIYDRAREYYHQVYQMGTSGAGGLYLQAADKLKQGFEQPQDKINRIVLGRVRVFSDKAAEQGEKVIITIPVQSVPGEQIEGRDLEVSVKFFDEVGARKEIAEADTTSCVVQSKWITEPLDWGTGEELLQVSYCIPTQDRQEEHLFGEKHYYGQVVELSYKGELIDAQAWPRILAHKLNKPDAPPVFLDREMPPGYNPYNPLLPNAPTEDFDRGARPNFSVQDAPLPSADYPAEEALPLPVPPEYQNLPHP